MTGLADMDIGTVSPIDNIVVFSAVLIMDACISTGEPRLVTLTAGAGGTGGSTTHTSA